MFSEARLGAVLRASAGRTSAELVKAVTEAVRGYVGTALPSDDITMMAIRRLTP
jgi:serine phosphatase RsbU (regulator of sigma subunit)